MTVDEVYSIIKYILKKNQNGNLKPEDFNLNINVAQRQYVAFLCGSMSGYMQGRPLPKAEFGNNRTARQRLSTVIITSPITIDGTGSAPYPDGYIQTDQMYATSGIKPLRYVEQHKLSGVLYSRIDPVATNPIYLIQDTGFQFYPINIGTANVSYVQNPPNIKWAYTLDVNGRPIYDSINSADPVFDEVAILDIIARSLLMAGINLQQNQVVQYANEVKTQGN